MQDLGNAEARCLAPSGDFVVGAPQPPVRMIGAKGFDFVRSKIDDDKAPRRPQNARETVM